MERNIKSLLIFVYVEETDFEKLVITLSIEAESPVCHKNTVKGQNEFGIL